MSLVVDFVGHKAAKYACRRWHYSKCLPASKIVKIGVWENGQFIGCVLYSYGATPMLCRSYNLPQTDVVELSRIALDTHVTPISKIIKISLIKLKQNSPKLKLVISFADPAQGHVGIIYQAAGWKYTGTSASERFHWYNGKYRHPRIGRRRCKSEKSKIMPGKHRYVKILDKSIQNIVALPYPKRCGGSIDSDAPDFQSGDDGASPISPLEEESKTG